MDKQFPSEFKQLASASNVRAAFVSEIKPLLLGDCPNCGSVGTMYIFIATVGPLQSPAFGKDIKSHWADGKWWGGRGFEFDCPVCHSLDKPYKGTETVWERDKRVSEQLALLTEEWEVK